MDPFASRIRSAIASQTGLEEADVRLESPRDASMGDYAFPCFPLAKALRKAPPAIAAELASSLGAELGGDPGPGPGRAGIEAVATGPYVNFLVERALLAETVLGSVLEAGEDWGGSREGEGRTVVLDFSSPNIAKPMSVGHLRSTVIGATVQRLHDALGYTTVGINHIGDWGSQFGKLVAAVNRWGDTVDLEEDPIRSLLSLYVRYHEEEEGDPDLQEEGRAAFRELESGEDGAVRAIWRHLTELSLREFDKTYDRLGVSFNEVRGESFYETHLEDAVARVEAAGITEMSEGALIVDLSATEKNMPPCLLRKTDGTTLYATRDLAAVFHRFELHGFERCLYMVGSDQKLHFRQLKGVLARMGLDWEPRVEHIAFGMMRLPEGKMSTRAGRVVFLEDVLDRAVEEARRIIGEKNPDLAGADAIAEQVGVGAVVFNDQRRERVKDIEFVWEEVLSFEGETGPYVQYTHARLASILRKAAQSGEAVARPLRGELLEDAAPLLLAMLRFPEALRSAAAHAEPSEVVTWLLAFCREVNAWYGRSRVLGQEADLTGARLALITGCKSVISNGLRLIGVAAPEEM